MRVHILNEVVSFFHFPLTTFKKGGRIFLFSPELLVNSMEDWVL